jgi:hypothetical protein
MAIACLVRLNPSPPGQGASFVLKSFGYRFLFLLHARLGQFVRGNTAVI